MLQNNSVGPAVAANRVAPILPSVQTAKYRPLMIRMLIACVIVALALMMMVPSVSKAADVVNVNKANAEMLQTLPDIGEKRAKAIISYRKKNGGFKNKQDLLNVPGIGDKILAKITRRVSVSGGGVSLGSSSKDKKKDSKKSAKKSSTGSKDKKADKRSLSKSTDKAKTETKTKKTTDTKKTKKSSSKKSTKKKSGSSSKKKTKKKSSS